MATKKTTAKNSQAITQFDIDSCKLLSDEFLAAIEEVATKYGVSVWTSLVSKTDADNFKVVFEISKAK